MNSPRSPRASLAALFAILGASLAPAAFATILVEDSFSYGGASNVVLDLVTPANSVGLTGNWSFSTASAKYWSYRPSGGLAMPGYGGSGGGVQFTQSNFSPSNAQRQLTTPLGSGTYYVGYLFSIDTNGNDGSVGAVLLGSSGANTNSAAVAISADEFQSNNAGSRVAGNVSINGGTPVTRNNTFGTIYLSLSSITLDGTNISISRYILTADQFSHFNGLAGGLDANLNQSIATGTGSTNVLERGTQTRANTTTSLPYIILEGYAGGSSYTLNFDELRVSNAGFNEIAAVPEPRLTALLVAAGLVVLLLRRRSLALRA